MYDEEAVHIIKISMGLIHIPTVQDEDVTVEDIVESIKDGLLEELKADNIEHQEKYDTKLGRLQIEQQKKLEELRVDNFKVQEKYQMELDKAKERQQAEMQNIKDDLNKEMQELKDQNEILLNGMKELTKKKGFFAKLFNK